MHTDSVRHLARIYLPPISWVHPLLPFVGHAVSRHDLARLVSSVFLLLFLLHLTCGQECRCLQAYYPRDVITLSDDDVLYQLHPANDTAQSYSRKSTGLQVVFHGRKRRAP